LTRDWAGVLVVLTSGLFPIDADFPN